MERVAARRSDDTAVVVGETGERLTFGQLDDASNRFAQLMRRRGLGVGDHIAVLFDNTAAVFPVLWGAQRSGLYFTPVNWHLTVDEAAYIVNDCGARVLVASAALRDLATEVAARAPRLESRLMTGSPPPQGWESLDDALHAMPAEPIDDQAEGMVMFYSSGTTGLPKGIKRESIGAPWETTGRFEDLLVYLFGFDERSVYLCPGPIYHAAPLGWSMATQRLGGTVVLMQRFDAERALQLVEQHHVTHVQFVPTMLIRMLKLTEKQRASYDLSSLRLVVHAAAPCPIEVKERLIDWLGPIVHEYYAGSEGSGFAYIDSASWLAHKGSVGRLVVGTAHICDDDGTELPVGEVGTVWFEGTAPFEYHNDRQKTKSAFNEMGWSTLGDMGHLDAEGYLYLSDRRVDLILSGGVNVYPQEIENVLTLHPAVADVCVIGVPDEEMGQQVKAIVQPVPDASAGESLADELIAYCRDRLAHYKCPRSIEFTTELPRLPSGKMLRRVIRDRHESRPMSRPGRDGI